MTPLEAVPQRGYVPAMDSPCPIRLMIGVTGHLRKFRLLSIASHRNVCLESEDKWSRDVTSCPSLRRYKTGTRRRLLVSTSGEEPCRVLGVSFFSPTGYPLA